MSLSSSEPTIRRLSPDDIALLRSVNELFAEAFEMPDDYLGTPPPDDYLRRLLAKDSFICVAAIDGDTVVGGLTAYVLEKLEQARSEIYIYDLAVAESHRRQGIATALIGEVRRIGRERDTWVVIIEADDGDEAPIGLYDKLSIQHEIAHHFDIAVD